MIVEAAGALRTSPELLEVFRLLDQPDRSIIQSAVANTTLQPGFVFNGERRMSREEVDGLRRVVRILHAVVVGKDHGGSTLKVWRNLRRKPLDMALASEPDRYPELSKLVSFTDQSGATVDCEKIVSELSTLWGATGAAEPSQVRHWIEAFHPIALEFSGDEPMQTVFERARTILLGQG